MVAPPVKRIHLVERQDKAKMSGKSEVERFTIDHKKLPLNYPTHMHSAEFWEAVGRTIATFGFLEEVLGKAIFSFTATKSVPEKMLEAEFERWLPTLQKALHDPLGSLINSYERAVHANSDATIKNLADLLGDLRKASTVRNVLCHGSWRVPDENGRSIPHFVDRECRVFQTPVDVEFLQQVHRHVAELACAVINTVTHMGWRFPGSGGPGNPILRSQRGNEAGG